MKFDRVRLENFKCYADADLRLDRGVTVIHGVNGSGKSSLLEACFFALYGARALDRTLDELVTIGAEEATVELWFAHGGESYHLKRRVRVTDDRASTAECVLEQADGVVEGARDVRERVTSLLRMDHSAFVNCAYVRQGEVNKLINATPSERQDMIDDLLQLGKLEEYRERASDARLGVKSVLDDRRGSLTELESQVEAKEDKELHGLLNDLESKRNGLTEKIERYEAQKENARETRDEAAAVLESYEEKREELAELDEDVEDLQSKIANVESERDDLRDRAVDLRETVEDRREQLESLLADTDLDAADEEAIDARLEALDEERADVDERLEQARTNAKMFDNQATNLADRAADLETRADDNEDDLADRREKLEDLDAEIESHRATFDDAPVAFGEAEA